MNDPSGMAMAPNKTDNVLRENDPKDISLNCETVYFP